MGGLLRQAPGGTLVFLIGKGNESRQFKIASDELALTSA